MRNWTLLIALATLAGVALQARAEEEPRAPAIERCREFCARVFGDSGGEFDECAVACGDADMCHRNCKQKFGEDKVKVNRCLRGCMQHNQSPEKPEKAPADGTIKL